jgi:hypothetical protein
MNNLQAKDLLQAKALGCLDPEENSEFSKIMKEDADFPWQEFGHYQNLVAFLPSLLEIEIPDQEVKDSIARKLYEFKEKIKEEEKSNQFADVEEDTILEDAKDESIIIEEEKSPVSEIPFEEPAVDEKEKIKKEISFKEHGIMQIPVSEQKAADQKTPVEPKSKTETKTSPRLSKKEYEQKRVKSYISKTPGDIKRSEIIDNKRGLLTTIILFVIALLVLIIIFFKLSSDIQDNRDEIERIKEQITSGALLDNFILNNTEKT